MKLTPKQMRLAMEKTRQEVAEVLGIHPNTLDKLEESPSKFSYEQGKKLCDYYGVSMDDFSFLP